MREVKFRSWNKDEQKMYGNWKSGIHNTNQRFWGNIVVKRNTVLMQYTGLKDKNGKEIYEGDILRLNGGADDFYGDVLFENGCFVFNAHWIEDGKMNPELYHYTQVKFVDCEVAGNVHENPELLEE